MRQATEVGTMRGREGERRPTAGEVVLTVCVGIGALLPATIVFLMR